MNKLIMMVGLVASGKSTLAKELSVRENAIILSSDDLREELLKDVNEQNNNTIVFEELHKRIKKHLKNGENVIYDATNINYKRRMAFLNEIKNIDCEKICYLIATPYAKCLEQNSKRDRKVPEEAIKRMYKNIYIPQYYEGWDLINIVLTIENKYDTNALFNGENGLNFINQDNPHHTLTIGNHCLKCSMLCEELIDDFELNIAALYHDIGKRFTKEFINSKNEVTETAHYYNHNLVSAYDSIFYLLNLDQQTILKITNYIQWHMQPFFIKTEKSKYKFINLVGEDFYNKLILLHQADINAK